MGSNIPNATPASETPNGQAPTSETLTPQPGETPGNGTPTQSPADLHREIERLKGSVSRANAEAKEFRLKAEELDKIKDAQMKEQGEFKELAEKHEARVKVLEPISERYNQLSGLVSEQIETEIKDWPASVKKLDPGKDAAIEVRLAWRNNARAIVAEMQQQNRGQMPGNGPNPRPATGEQTREQQIKDFKQKRVNSGAYGM